MTGSPQFRPVSRLLTCCFITLIPAPAVNAEALNPTTYRSTSGVFELFVDPSAHTGAGPGTYRFSRGGEEVWAGERPFTLRHATLTDDGVIAGIAYEGGVREGGHHGAMRKGLSIIIIGPDGVLRQRDEGASHESGRIRRDFSGSDSPAVSGLITDPAHDRFIVLICGRGSSVSVWWTYRLSDGAKTGDITPDRPAPPGRPIVRTLTAHLVPGTDLVLTHWYTSRPDGDKWTNAAVLSLLDAAGKDIWTQNFPGEYDGLGDRWSWWDLRDAPPQVQVGERHFSFRSYRSAHRILYVLQPDSELVSGWRVVESVRVRTEPLSDGRDDARSSEPDAIELEHLGTIVLQGPDAAASPVGRIFEFAVEPSGNVGFVRRGDQQGDVRFVRVDRDGTVLSDVLLDLPEDGQVRPPRTVPVGNDRWVVLRPSDAEDVGTSIWRFDPDTGVTEHIADFQTSDLDSVVSTGDGGFLVLARHHLEGTIEDELSMYDRDGRRVWNRREPGYGRGLRFKAVTWLPDDRIAALTMRTIELFDGQGNHVESKKIADIIGTGPNYTTGLTTDKDGGLILHDFNGSPPIYRIGADGDVTSKFRPRFRDGRTFRLYGDVKCAPDGTLWTSDGHALLRLDENGVVERVVGRRPDDEGLGDVRTLTVDGHGRIYAIDDRTSHLHVFEPNGTPIHVCRPDPTDNLSTSPPASITVDGNGDVYCAVSSAPDRLHVGYLRFAADGQRIGIEHFDFASNGDAWLFKPGSRERWVLGYRSIHLLDSTGEVTRAIQRRPNDHWLERVVGAAVAPDGSLAVVVVPGGLGRRSPVVVCIYDAEGKGAGMITLSPDSRGFVRIAFNGSTVITCEGDYLGLYPIGGQPPRRFSLPMVDGRTPWWVPHIAPGGTEVWVWPKPQRRLLRFAVP